MLLNSIYTADTVFFSILEQSQVVTLFDTLSISKVELLKILKSKELGRHVYLGTAGIGFVFGWIVSFINKHTATKNINTGYLTAIIASLLGTVVLTFFENNRDLLGSYGIGVFIGLASYFIIVIIYGFKDRSQDVPVPDQNGNRSSKNYSRAVEDLFR